MAEPMRASWLTGHQGAAPADAEPGRSLSLAGPTKAATILTLLAGLWVAVSPWLTPPTIWPVSAGRPSGAR